MGTHCAQLNYGRCGITLAAGGVVEEHEKGRGTCLIHYEDTVQKQIKRITAETKDPAGAAVLLIRKRRNDVDASTLFAFERGFGRGRLRPWRCCLRTACDVACDCSSGALFDVALRILRCSMTLGDKSASSVLGLQYNLMSIFAPALTSIAMLFIDFCRILRVSARSATSQ